MSRKNGLIIVDNKDNVLGTEDKEKCHQGEGILHRAIFVLILNQEGQLLLTQRSKLKKLWPLNWDGACASHPYPKESYLACAKRRIKEELGLSCPLKFTGKFQYQASYKNVGSENEICAVFVGKYNSQIKPNPAEVADWQWIDLDELKKEIKRNPDKYTPWLKMVLGSFWERISQNLGDSLPN